ncbi:MAG: C39 family peptidase [Anaerolineales bacterium]|nr:C39 family peptidase [Anaerolineales bacterium]
MKAIRSVNLIINLLLAAILVNAFIASPVQAADSPPKKATIRGVTGWPQRFNLSCESRSAVDWAAFWGVQISETKFLKKLPRSDNPNKGFVGQPSDPLGKIPPDSYGVHAGPVAELLREYGLQAEARTGIAWKELKMEIAAGRPVIVWVIGQMWKGDPVEYQAANGEIVQVAAYEHTMLLVGYNSTSVRAIDAASGLAQDYPLRNFLASWGVLGNMAITGGLPGDLVESDEGTDQPPDPATETPEPGQDGASESGVKIYTVRRGDYLTGIARRLGVNWKAVARLNGLKPPYILHPGQKLQIP